MQKEDGLLFMDTHTPLRTEVRGQVICKMSFKYNTICKG